MCTDYKGLFSIQYLSNAVNQLGDKNKSEAIVTSKKHYVAVLFFVCRYLMVKNNVLLLWANKVKQIISGRHDVYIVLLYQLFFLQERKKEKKPHKNVIEIFGRK